MQPLDTSEAMKQLESRYGRPSAIYPTLVEELTSREQYDYMQDAMHSIMEKLQILSSMKKIKGCSIEQLTVAMIVRDFNEELHKEWVKHIGSKEDLPNVESLLKFIEPLSFNLDKRTKSSSHVVNTLSKHQQQEDKRFGNGIFVSDSRVCAICKSGQHPLFKCQTFINGTVAQSWNWIKQHKYCSNCLHFSHAACTVAHNSIDVRLAKEDTIPCFTEKKTNENSQVRHSITQQRQRSKQSSKPS